MKKTILLVDDERDTLIQVSRLLERAGYRVIAFSAADEVLSAASAGELQFDLLLTDMDLASEWTGEALISELRHPCFGFSQPMILWSGGEATRKVSTEIHGPDLIMDKGHSADLIAQIQRLLADR